MPEEEAAVAAVAGDGEEPSISDAQIDKVLEIPLSTDMQGVSGFFINLTNMVKMGMKDSDEDEECKPFKIFRKKDCLDEVQKVGFYSEWYEHSAMLKAYTGTELLVIRDKERVFGENFAVTTTLEAYERECKRLAILREKKRQQLIEEQNQAGSGEGDEEAEVELEYVERQFVPRMWASATAEQTHADVDAFSIKNSRPLMVVEITRKRREFGAPYKFNDREPGEGFMECRSQKDPNFTLRRKEVDIGFQAIPEMAEMATQTAWFRSVNSSTQFCAEDFLSQEATVDSSSKGVVDFLGNVSTLVEQALQQNETLDLFKDEFSVLTEEDGTAMGGKLESHIKEFRTYYDLEFCGGKVISCIDWQPKTTSVVAVSCIMNLNFDQRVDIAGKARTSVVILWTFTDLTHPQCILEAPNDIVVFKFNPNNPDIVVGGTFSGQVTVWDINHLKSRLQVKKKSPVGSQDDDEKGDKVPKSDHLLLSTIDDSHRRPVSDIVWLPSHMQLDKRGNISVNADSQTLFFATTSGDGMVCFWDTNWVKEYKRDSDFSWRPLFRIQMHKPGSSSEIGGGQIIFNKLTKDDREKLEKGDKAPNASRFFCTSEDGDLMVVDWQAKPMSEEEKRPEYVQKLMDAEQSFRPTLSFQRSPFYPDLFLTVHDWQFHIWKEDIEAPIFSSSYTGAYLTGGRWSPTRPGVLVMSRNDGHIDVWDLIDQSQNPSLTHSVTSNRLTSLDFLSHSSVSGGSSGQQQLLALGDDQGNLHVVEMPKNIRRKLANEENTMRAFFEREVKRVAYVKQRLAIRSKEKEAHERAMELAKDRAEAAVTKTVPDPAVLDQAAEAEYRALEAKFKAELGITD